MPRNEIHTPFTHALENSRVGNMPLIPHGVLKNLFRDVDPEEKDKTKASELFQLLKTQGDFEHTPYDDDGTAWRMFSACRSFLLTPTEEWYKNTTEEWYKEYYQKEIATTVAFATAALSCLSFDSSKRDRDEDPEGPSKRQHMEPTQPIERDDTTDPAVLEFGSNPVSPSKPILVEAKEIAPGPDAAVQHISTAFQTQSIHSRPHVRTKMLRKIAHIKDPAIRARQLNVLKDINPSVSGIDESYAAILKDVDVGDQTEMVELEEVILLIPSDGMSSDFVDAKESKLENWVSDLGKMLCGVLANQTTIRVVYSARIMERGRVRTRVRFGCPTQFAPIFESLVTDTFNAVYSALSNFMKEDKSERNSRQNSRVAQFMFNMFPKIIVERDNITALFERIYTSEQIVELETKAERWTKTFKHNLKTTSAPTTVGDAGRKGEMVGSGIVVGVPK